jgi:Xaa-Pro aminopeptidase
MKHDFSVYALRRKDLVTAIAHRYPNNNGVIAFFGGFESKKTVFRQESSFYYLTGIREPGVVMVLDLNGKADLYIPNCATEREKWSKSHVELTQGNASHLGFSAVHPLGQACTGYQFHPFFPRQEYATLLERLAGIVRAGGTVFTLTPDNPHEYVEQRLVLERLKEFLPEIAAALTDISPLVASMRRKKDMGEIEALYKAVEITMLAHEAAAHALGHGVLEGEVQANLEYMFTGSGARCAFPSIVAGGKNGTVLHYVENSDQVKNGDLVIVDIGAENDYYCADLTRTYPVSGKFTQRQREIYNLVLATQEYIAELAKPGMWLSNKEHPDKSLNHLAKKYLSDRGYGHYFVHGIGHYLGLDVHDVGDYTTPLQEGDVITIEPGIYIPEEGIGVRIEDDFWIVRDGVVCLSDPLPRTVEEIEHFMKEGLEADDPAFAGEEEYDDDDAQA